MVNPPLVPEPVRPMVSSPQYPAGPAPGGSARNVPLIRKRTGRPEIWSRAVSRSPADSRAADATTCGTAAWIGWPGRGAAGQCPETRAACRGSASNAAACTSGVFHGVASRALTSPAFPVPARLSGSDHTAW